MWGACKLYCGQHTRGPPALAVRRSCAFVVFGELIFSTGRGDPSLLQFRPWTKEVTWNHISHFPIPFCVYEPPDLESLTLQMGLRISSLLETPTPKSPPRDPSCLTLCSYPAYHPHLVPLPKEEPQPPPHFSVKRPVFMDS